MISVTLLWQPDLAPLKSMHVCDIVTSKILAGPVKMIEHKQDEHENIEKKVDIFHNLNGILAKTRNLIFQERFPGRIVDT